MVKDPCGNCGSIEWRFWRYKIIEVKGESLVVESCDQCKGIKPSYPRDAQGQKVSWPTGEKRYSYATDSVIGSERQLSEHLKRNNMVQKG